MLKFYNVYKLVASISKNCIRNQETIPKRLYQNIKFYKPNLILAYKNSTIHPDLRFSRTKILALTILGWLGFEKTDEEKESELIMTLKRAVLSEQREEFNKAEQLLHLALRLAQQQQNQQGILYCYDLMANLAFNQLQLDKSEKLFVSVMQILLSNGLAQDDLKVN